LHLALVAVFGWWPVSWILRITGMKWYMHLRRTMNGIRIRNWRLAAGWSRFTVDGVGRTVERAVILILGVALCVGASAARF